MSMFELELALVVFTLVLTIIFASLVYGLSKELNLGIFKRFFKLLIIAAIVSAAGRGLVLLQLGGRMPRLPVGLDVLSAMLFFFIITFAFWQLMRDWKRVSLDRPAGRGGGG
jgi:high-affinity Fe2+/Pb2+ permease